MPSTINSLIKEKLSKWPTAELALLPTPIHPLKNFSKLLDGQELWIKRDDLTGLEGGGNKTRKLDYLVGGVKASVRSGWFLKNSWINKPNLQTRLFFCRLTNSLIGDHMRGIILLILLTLLQSFFLVVTPSHR